MQTTLVWDCVGCGKQAHGYIEARVGYGDIWEGFEAEMFLKCPCGHEMQLEQYGDRFAVPSMAWEATRADRERWEKE